MNNMNSQLSISSIEIVDENLYIAGGYNSFTDTYNLEFDDKETGEWQEAKDMAIQCNGLSCCVLSGLLPQSSGSSRGYLNAQTNLSLH